MAVSKTMREQLRTEKSRTLVARLQSADADTQSKIALELGRRAETKAVEPLRELLSSKSPEVRAAAAEALGRIGVDSVGDDLATLLADRKQPEFVRDTCAYALARLAYVPALRILLKAYEDRSESVRRCARSAVFAIFQSLKIEPSSLSKLLAS
jgi:HEAT repeat protein